jgi:tetratricopeptide (TPR) repeat protein
MSGDLASARDETEHALSLYRAAGAQRGTMNALGNLAEISWELGDLDAALVRLDECVSQARKASSFNQRLSLGLALGLLAGVLTERGQLDEALAVGREALLLLKEAGVSFMLFDTFALRAGLVGKLVNAARLQGHSDSYFASRGVPRANNHARIRERLHVLLNEKLGPDELARLLVEGSKLSEDEACRIALED